MDAKEVAAKDQRRGSRFAAGLKSLPIWPMLGIVLDVTFGHEMNRTNLIVSTSLIAPVAVVLWTHLVLIPILETWFSSLPGIKRSQLLEALLIGTVVVPFSAAIGFLVALYNGLFIIFGGIFVGGMVATVLPYMLLKTYIPSLQKKSVWIVSCAGGLCPAIFFSVLNNHSGHIWLVPWVLSGLVISLAVTPQLSD